MTHRPRGLLLLRIRPGVFQRLITLPVTRLQPTPAHVVLDHHALLRIIVKPCEPHGGRSRHSQAVIAGLVQVVDGFNLVNELRVVITTVYVQLLLDQFARHLSDRFLIVRAAGTLHHRRFFHLGSARTAFCVRSVCGGA